MAERLMNSSNHTVMSANQETEQPIPGHDPRDTQARAYTKGDTPLHTGVLIPAEEWAESLG